MISLEVKIKRLVFMWNRGTINSEEFKSGLNNFGSVFFYKTETKKKKKKKKIGCTFLFPGGNKRSYLPLIPGGNRRSFVFKPVAYIWRFV